MTDLADLMNTPAANALWKHMSTPGAELPGIVTPEVADHLIAAYLEEHHAELGDIQDENWITHVPAALTLLCAAHHLDVEAHESAAAKAFVLGTLSVIFDFEMDNACISA